MKAAGFTIFNSSLNELVFNEVNLSNVQQVFGFDENIVIRQVDS